MTRGRIKALADASRGRGEATAAAPEIQGMERDEEDRTSQTSRPPKPRNKNDLVRRYREIGISAVAAAARYQDAQAGTQPHRHMQAKSSRANGGASLKSIRTK